MSYTVCHQAQLFFSSLHHPQSKLGFTSITNFTTQAPLMADIPNQQSPPPQSTTSQNHTLEQNQQISPPQTLDDSYTNSSSFTEEDDLINVDDADVPYTFVVDPFSPLDSSIFASSSSYLNNRNQQVNLNSCYRCLSESESDLESDCADSTVYPDCLVARIESDSDIEDLGAADDDQNDDRIETSELSFDSARVEERDGLSSVIERIEEISVSSDISSEGDASVGVLEWEILLAVNNFERGLEFATEGGEEGFVYTPEFDTLIGQFVESVRALRGSPPAAKSFIDNLPLVTLKKGDLNDDDTVICAVCKDEILMEERVTQLPCKHHYHGECIVPWLSIRNTCPVCRFELPTDDVEYERSKNRVDDDDGDGELRVGYGFDISP
ncbi:putative transcription factor C2H2 family [Helianthus annuus]|nr:putative transcription factor C2H2 family [Helianthus annuus]